MKKKAGNLVICIIFLAGLSLLLYPFVANQWNNYRQKQLISDYDSIVSAEDAAGEIDYAAELEKARAYNEALLPSILPDSFAVAEAAGYTVAWDANRGAVVSDSANQAVFSIRPDSRTLYTADGSASELEAPCLISNGTSYLLATELADLLNLYIAG